VERYPPSQGEIIAAFIKWLNVERKAAYEISRRPDEQERRLPAIDYILTDRGTGDEIAVEVSSIWRTGDAGMEDAYIDKWFEEVRSRVRGRVAGRFYVTMPIAVPRGLKSHAFAEELVAVIQREARTLSERGKHGKNIAAEVAGIQVHVSQGRAEGSDVQYARHSPDLKDFPERVRNCLDAKAPKLLPYRDAGIETWIVVYNTLWTAMANHEVREVFEAEFGPQHAHVLYIGVCEGDPPDDAWIEVIEVIR
jgi:hypothetical protein